MELLVFGHGGAPVLAFPARFGRFYEYENWGVVGALRNHLENGWFQIYCLDSIDGEALYCTCRAPRQRIERHMKYEEYVLEEVLPLIQKLNSNPFRIAFGCSLGAYHAVNLALRHPWLFGKVVGLSGRYDLTEPVDSFRPLFDGYYDADVYFHTPGHFLLNLGDQHILDPIRRMEIILAVGEADPFLESNRRLSTALWEKGAWNALHVWGGRAHKAHAWRQMAPLYL